MRWRFVSAARRLAAVVCVPSAIGCASEAPAPAATADQDLVGGTAEMRYTGVGYLADTANPGVALCGATLIAPNVAVTAAHCVYRNRAKKLAFGVGELAAKTQYPVAEIAYHPDSHLEAAGSVDLVHALLLYDVAYLVLANPVANAAPLGLPTTKPALQCNARLVGYGSAPSGNAQIRKGLDGCVFLNAKLASDTIVEVRPKMGGAVCHRDGDEGHAAVVLDAKGAPQLLGLYVGSVTQGLTDCKKYVQLLNGYEASFGYGDFYAKGIARGQQLLGK